MPIFDARLLRRETIAEGTMAFVFERPAGFDFEAGQFANFTLIDPPETDDEGDLRSFSIASAPYEPDLTIATRMRDTAFKRTLRALAPGTVVELDGPAGEFVLGADRSRPAVFLAGGIGITPFRSMIRQAIHERRGQPIVLFYSNRRPEDAAFLDELRAIAQPGSDVQLVATMAEMEKSQRAWDGPRGFIREALLREVLHDLTEPVYYVAGPPAMVLAMAAMLEAAGVSARSIVAEEFAGY
jgi:ferredoxin-NADP reductase